MSSVDCTITEDTFIHEFLIERCLTMYIIRVYVDHKLTKIIKNNDKSLMMERYKLLARNTEQYTFDFGCDTKAELYENDKLINCIETEF